MSSFPLNALPLGLGAYRFALRIRSLLRRARGTFCGVVASGLLVAAAHAHDAWLLPSSTVLSQAEWITVDAAVSNDLFFFNHAPLKLDGLEVTAPDGSTLAPQNIERGKLRSVFDLELKDPGTYRLAVHNNALFATYTDGTGKPRRWRGTPDKLASGALPTDARDVVVTQLQGLVETYVTVGKPTVPRPGGSGLEMVALTHPNDLVGGEAATFMLQIDGQVAAGLKVQIIAGNSRYRDDAGAQEVITDERGRFSFTWPHAGMYWLSASARDGKATVPQAAERRLSYAVTLEVLP